MSTKPNRSARLANPIRGEGFLIVSLAIILGLETIRRSGYLSKGLNNKPCKIEHRFLSISKSHQRLLESWFLDHLSYKMAGVTKPSM